MDSLGASSSVCCYIPIKFSTASPSTHPLDVGITQSQGLISSLRPASPLSVLTSDHQIDTSQSQPFLHFRFATATRRGHRYFPLNTVNTELFLCPSSPTERAESCVLGSHLPFPRSLAHSDDVSLRAASSPPSSLRHFGSIPLLLGPPYHRCVCGGLLGKSKPTRLGTIKNTASSPPYHSS